jgi:hypothetical protein
MAAGRQLKKRSVTFAPLGAAAEDATALADAVEAAGEVAAAVVAAALVAAAVDAAVVAATLVAAALAIGALVEDATVVVAVTAVVVPPQAASSGRARVAAPPRPSN